MKKKYMTVLITGTIIVSFMFSTIVASALVVPAFAAEQEDSTTFTDDNGEEDTSATNGDYDYTKDEEYTQSFYRPKSLFQSSYEYEEYCKRMYNMGYMDSDYDWTPAAQDFIDNMTGDNMKALDKNAKEIVQQRIKDGEMKEEDNPYLTYDQKQALSEKNSKDSQTEDSENVSDSTNSEQSSDASTDSNASSDMSTSKDDNTITVTPEEEQTEKEDEKPSSLANRIKLVFMVLLAVGIALVTYSIYKKQF